MKSEDASGGGRVPGRWLTAALLLCCILMFTAGCTQSGAKTDDTVRVNYTASFQDGTVFDTNLNSAPLEFTVGKGQVIPGFDEAVIGMTPGMSKTVTIPPEKGYGIHNTSMVFRESLEEVNAFIQDQEDQGNIVLVPYPGIGPVFSWVYPDGSRGYMRLTNSTDTMVTVDLNNPLAGKTLVFDIQLVEIVQ